MALLNNMGNPFAQFAQMQKDPFTRQMPSFFGQQQMPSMGGLLGQGGNMGAMQMQGAQMPDQSMPTDFAGTSAGLPNLPESMQGFGFGQTAPELNVNASFRDNIIQQMLSTFMQKSGLEDYMSMLKNPMSHFMQKSGASDYISQLGGNPDFGGF